MILMLVVSGLLVVIAAIVARTQLSNFRASQAKTGDDADLFVYTRRRLYIRLGGAVALASTGITLAVWELSKPLSALHAQQLVSVLITEVAALILVAILDLRETARSSRR